MTHFTLKRSSANTIIIPVAVTVLCLLPFVNKAFHIDDILFIWTAKHIQNDPVNFFDFTVNWYGIQTHMADTNKNPPGVCYYIAIVGSLFGYSEIALHLAFLIPAVAVAMGTYYLAKQFCSRPTLATLAVVLTPAFLVSSTNVMTDTMMLLFWVWAVLLWILGLKNNKRIYLFFSGLLIVFCVLTKYSGISLLGLIAVYSLLKKRKLGGWLLFLLIPIAILAWYELATWLLYGHGLLSDSVRYVTDPSRIGQAGLLQSSLICLAFTGGCVISVLFYSPLLWSRRVLAAGGIGTILLLFALTFVEKIGVFAVRHNDSINWSFLIQFVLMILGGVSLIYLAARDFWKNKDADSLLLALWVFGIFIFTGYVNWTINARSILLMVPAAGILLMRRIDELSTANQKTGTWHLVLPLIPAAIVALSVTWADYTLADTARSAAIQINKKFKNRQSGLWFQGHWGFQYYMEANGFEAFDFVRTPRRRGDFIAIPLNNTNTRYFSKKKVQLEKMFKFSPCRWLATMNRSLGAGFYANARGPLPYAIGPVDSELYYVFRVK